MERDIVACEGFEWDAGNIDKNWRLHEVTDTECEEVFFNSPLLLAPDERHSRQEVRAYALGRTDANRWLFVSFVIRYRRIRVISAREMNEREARKYAERIRRDSSLHQ
jgi:hypothetical protein